MSQQNRQKQNPLDSQQNSLSNTPHNANANVNNNANASRQQDQAIPSSSRNSNRGAMKDLDQQQGSHSVNNRQQNKQQGS